MAWGADTHTHTHAYIRTEVISINRRAPAAGRRAPGLKSVITKTQEYEVSLKLKIGIPMCYLVMSLSSCKLSTMVIYTSTHRYFQLLDNHVCYIPPRKVLHTSIKYSP